MGESKAVRVQAVRTQNKLCLKTLSALYYIHNKDMERELNLKDILTEEDKRLGMMNRLSDHPNEKIRAFVGKLRASLPEENKGILMLCTGSCKSAPEVLPQWSDY